jgi:allantoin racemase
VETVPGESCCVGGPPIPEGTMAHIGLIRVLSTTDRRLLNAHGQVVRDATGHRVTSRAVADQPHGIHDDASHDAAAPKVRSVADSLSREVDGILISCSSDPALDELRETLSVPVVGAGSAGAAAALSLGTRVGVLTLNSATPGAVSRVLGRHLLAAESPHGVLTTSDLLTPSGVFETYRAAERLLNADVDVILQACTGLTSMGVAAELRRRSSVPVVDAVLAAGTALATEISARRQLEMRVS